MSAHSPFARLALLLAAAAVPAALPAQGHDPSHHPAAGGDGPDVLAFDPGPGRLYVAPESGTVSTFRVRGRDLVHAGDLRIPHAHTVAVDPATHLVYFPLQEVNGRPLLRIMAP